MRRGAGEYAVRRWSRRLAACFVMAGFGVLGTGQAEALTVLTVPKNPQDPNVPHNAYNGKQTTYKAIVRDGNCGTYEYWWDPDGDGDEDSGRLTTTNPYNLQYQWQIPNQANDRLFAARVRVACNGEEAIGSYLVYVNASVPAPGDANTANADQLAIMSDVALDDVLWQLHKLGQSYGGAGAAISGWINHQSGENWDVATTGAAMWAFALNGHYPAYPPGTYAGPEPAGFIATNNQLWARTPYAETGVRYMNYLLTRFANRGGINANDEADDGRPAIAGTNDGNSLQMADDTYRHNVALGGLAVVAANMPGTTSQVGGATAGQLWPWIIRSWGVRTEHPQQGP